MGKFAMVATIKTVPDYSLTYTRLFHRFSRRFCTANAAASSRGILSSSTGFPQPVHRLFNRLSAALRRLRPPQPSACLFNVA